MKPERAKDIRTPTTTDHHTTLRNPLYNLWQTSGLILDATPIENRE